MIVTTTDAIEGKQIVKYYGLVASEAIVGANIFKDFMASITDVVGGRSSGYEKALKEAKDIAVHEMIAQAEELGANAIVGIDLDYESVGKTNGMLMVSANGTAVKVQ